MESFLSGLSQYYGSTPTTAPSSFPATPSDEIPQAASYGNGSLLESLWFYCFADVSFPEQQTQSYFYDSNALLPIPPSSPLPLDLLSMGPEQSSSFYTPFSESIPPFTQAEKLKVPTDIPCMQALDYSWLTEQQPSASYAPTPIGDGFSTRSTSPASGARPSPLSLHTTLPTLSLSVPYHTSQLPAVTSSESGTSSQDGQIYGRVHEYQSFNVSPNPRLSIPQTAPAAFQSLPVLDDARHESLAQDSTHPGIYESQTSPINRPQYTYGSNGADLDCPADSEVPGITVEAACSPVAEPHAAKTALQLDLYSGEHAASQLGSGSSSGELAACQPGSDSSPLPEQPSKRKKGPEELEEQSETSHSRRKRPKYEEYTGIWDVNTASTTPTTFTSPLEGTKFGFTDGIHRHPLISQEVYHSIEPHVYGTNGRVDIRFNGEAGVTLFDIVNGDFRQLGEHASEEVNLTKHNKITIRLEMKRLDGTVLSWNRTQEQKKTVHPARIADDSQEEAGVIL